jgi:hypothetical protein
MSNEKNGQLLKWFEGKRGDQPFVRMDDPVDSSSEPGDPEVSGDAVDDSVGMDDRVACSSDTGESIGVAAPSESSTSAEAEQRPQNTDPKNVNDTPKKRIYPSDFDGRFIVYIREWKMSLPHVTISRYLCKKYTSAILQIEKVHKQKIRVECSNAFTANLIVADEELNQEFRVSIPADVVEINGVISVSNDLNTLDLVNFGAGVFGNPSIPSVEIVDAYRMRRSFSQNGKVVSVDSDQVRVTFKGRALPKLVIVYGLRVPVRLYKPKLMFCEKCQGFNHTSKFCTSPLKCGKCREQHDTASCQQGPKCPLCLEDVVHQKREECPVFRERTVSLQNRVKIRSKLAYSKLISSSKNEEVISQENQFSLLSEDSGEDEEILEGSSYASVLIGKRRRPTNTKSSPPKRKVSVQENVKPGTSKTSTPKTDSIQANRKKNIRTSGDHAETNDFFDSLKASISDFIESCQIPPFWARLASSIVSRVLDFLLPKISPLISLLFPQSQNV